RAGDPARDLAETLLHQIAGFGLEGAHGAAQPRRIRNHIECIAALEDASRQHRAVHWIDIARNDRLQSDDDLRADHDRIDAFLRIGGMTALAANGDLELVRRGHLRTRADEYRADRIALRHVHAEDGLDRRIVEHTGLDHALRA